MNTSEVKTLTITLQDKDIDTFKKVVQKVTEETQKAGFTNNLLDADQKQFIKNLNDKLNQ